MILFDLKYLGMNMFEFNTKLSTVILQEGLPTISYRMFMKTALRTVTIPGSVTVIGKLNQ